MPDGGKCSAAGQDPYIDAVLVWAFESFEFTMVRVAGAGEATRGAKRNR
jgi:hypothetical protein